jgi:hypothetical protein
MKTIETSARTIQLPEEELIVDEAQLAAVVFLARYSGRTLRRLPRRPARLAIPAGGYGAPVLGHAQVARPQPEPSICRSL